MQDVDIAEQNIITIRDEEIDYFEGFTKKHGIRWSLEEKNSLILPLSKSYVGYINTPIRTISLLPKYREITFDHIFRMYLFVNGYKANESPAVLDISDSEDNVDVAWIFLKLLRKNVQEGIIQSYYEKQMHLKSLRGRVNYSQTYANYRRGVKEFVQTSAATLSVDNIIDSLIKSALVKLIAIKKYSSTAQSLAPYFNAAQGNIKNGKECFSSINFNSNTERYRKTLMYAAMIIDQLNYNDIGQSVGTDSFLINFDALFEDFVIKVLKTMSTSKKFVTWSKKQEFAKRIGENSIEEIREYQPDIIFDYMFEDERFDYSSSAYAVLDVKNKAYGQFKNADIYQITTYARLLHSKKVILLYPSFYHRNADSLLLDSNIFDPYIIHACYVNIAENSGEEFLNSAREFCRVVENILYDIEH